MEEMRMQMWPAAEAALKRSIVMDRVAELEGLRATAGELEARIDEMAQRMGRPRGEVVGQLRKANRLDELEQEVTEQKVFDYLKSISDIQ
jgi:trigger factor